MKKYGLTTAEAEASRAKHGSNALSGAKKITFTEKLWDNFQDPIIRILLVALLVNVVFVYTGHGDWVETAGIFVAIMLATLVATWSEYSNENAFQKLQEEASRIYCRVWRDGEPVELPIDEIVVGDAVILAAGDKVPADGFMLEGSLAVDQAALNGESEEAEKAPAENTTPWDAMPIDLLAKNRLYRGSVVTSGQGIMEAVKIGDASMYGQLTQELKTEERDSPLKLKLKHLAQQISKLGYAGSALIILGTMLHKLHLASGFTNYVAQPATVVSDLLQAIILGIIIIVMAVPEGLPLMIAIVSSLNMRKMLKDNVLVRKLVGIETAGSLNLLFTDKTGTITKGKLELVNYLTADGREYSSVAELPALQKELLCQQVLLNTSATVTADRIVGGNMTEAALSNFLDTVRSASQPERIAFTPFNSTAKYSEAVVRSQGEEYALLKGAPEKLLLQANFYLTATGTREKFTNARREALEQKMDALASKAMRLLALCVRYKDEPLTLMAVVAIRDEVRPEAVAAIAGVQGAGVQVVMITGDRKETATAIAQDAGLLQKDTDLVLASAELAALSDAQVKELLPQLRVVARALPTDKSRLVRLAQELNLVVGMTGDGVNDAPALKKADVGCAMGSGTEVAKEAGDIVILDDNFLSIQKAILYGRTIYHSICKFIVFQLTINFAAVGISFIAPFLGIDKPLTITQILWINLVMDTLAAMAFGGEPALQAYLEECPRQRTAPLVSRKMLGQIVTAGAYMTIVGIVFFQSSWVDHLFRDAADHIYTYTGFFCTFIFMAIANGFNVRADGKGLTNNLAGKSSFVEVMTLVAAIQIALTFFGGKILRTAPLLWQEWLVVAGFAASVIIVEKIRKIIQ